MSANLFGNQSLAAIDSNGHVIKRRRRAPSDLEILSEIYDRYYDTFAAYESDSPSRVSKTYVPVDLVRVAETLGVDRDIVFGRLYSDLERRYGYTKGDAHIHFFAKALGDERHCVNFPYLASVLAELQEREEKHRTATIIAVVSLIVAAVSLAISLLS